MVNKESTHDDPDGLTMRERSIKTNKQLELAITCIWGIVTVMERTAPTHKEGCRAVLQAIRGMLEQNGFKPRGADELLRQDSGIVMPNLKLEQ
jgi:hypothetical protein